MRKLFCFLGSLLCVLHFAAAQKVHKGYRDGIVWYKLKDKVQEQYRDQASGRHIAINEFSFLQSLQQRLSLQKVAAPFARARTATPLKQTYALHFDEKTDADVVIQELLNSGMVAYAEKVPVYNTFQVPNDEKYIETWHLPLMHAPAAWEHTKGNNTIIAIVDVAVLTTHPDLAPNLWVNPGEIPGNGIDDDGNGFIDDIHGWNLSDNNNNPNPPDNTFNHGTAVAGCASAATNNSIGISSIGYNCKLMCIRAASVISIIDQGAQGIVYAADNGAHIINCSWGSIYVSNTLREAVNYALSKGCIIVAAAGNDNNSNKFYPAAYPGVVSVAATTSTDNKAAFSNFGDWVTVSAPGSAIFSTDVLNRYNTFGGTSFASPVAAGLLGLIRSLNPTLPRREMITLLTSTATNIDGLNPGYAGLLGAGRIDAGAAIQEALAPASRKPVSAFTVNRTLVGAGATVSFINESYYHPDTCTWTFSGGTPSSYLGQAPPPVVYRTPGTYQASLIVSNALGRDTQEVQISVSPSPTCGALNYPAPANWNKAEFTANPGGGYLTGVSYLQDRQKAMYFDVGATHAPFITKVRVQFGRAWSADTTKIIPVHVYDGSKGKPGHLIATATTTMGQIMRDLAGQEGTVVQFQQPVPVPASSHFFVSVDLTNLCWNDACKDTLTVLMHWGSVVSAWEQRKDSLWYAYAGTQSISLRGALYIHPYLTDDPTIATFTSDAAQTCSGRPVVFNAAGSTFGDAITWSFPNGSPAVSNQVMPVVSFPHPGHYPVLLSIKGGGCHDARSDTQVIVIKAPDTAAVQLTGSATFIFPGNFVKFTATPIHEGTAPLFRFTVNHVTVQSGASNTWTTERLLTNDTVSCELSSNESCLASSTAISNNWIMKTGDSPPVYLLYFTGTATQAGHLLTWSSQIEINVAYFVVERSNNGVQFTEAGRVTAAGRSTLVQAYLFTDRQPYNGITHYRLRIVDVKGHSSYSTIIIVKNNSSPITTVGAWPQPVQRGSSLHIKITTGDPGNIGLQLLDPQGRVLQTKKGSSNNGVYPFAIDTHALTGGLYFVRFYNSAGELLGNHAVMVK
jgi:subtilisin family serine protease